MEKNIFHPVESSTTTTTMAIASRAPVATAVGPLLVSYINKCSGKAHNLINFDSFNHRAPSHVP